MKVSRPLIALLVVVVVFFAIWTTALRSSVTGSHQGHGAPLPNAIAAAHGAVNTANAASVAHGGTVPQSTTTTAAKGQTATPSPAAPARTPPAAVPSPTRPTTPATREHAVEQALRANEVIALLFYNRGGADDMAVRAELASITVRGARILKLAVPLEQLSRYPVVTNRVAVVESPTLVLIDRSHRAHLLVGYTSGFELAQRIMDAIAGS